ncbi:hypothetical protein DB88DRAFT_519018 [Papiliotrema laurentii]|uniref:Uncharacterized protein n=1 Tax=Papiliotrema laurentii TaxID=5418 RepID=A0AAD9CTY5_PAPLA|nr:hypothetical protein DB88DRAFT_519018 [Papiliotrema laurentii]
MSDGPRPAPPLDPSWGSAVHETSHPSHIESHHRNLHESLPQLGLITHDIPQTLLPGDHQAPWSGAYPSVPEPPRYPADGGSSRSRRDGIRVSTPVPFSPQGPLPSVCQPTPSLTEASMSESSRPPTAPTTPLGKRERRAKSRRLSKIRQVIISVAPGVPGVSSLQFELKMLVGLEAGWATYVLQPVDSSYILDILATCQKLQNDYRIVIRAYVEAKSQFFLTITNHWLALHPRLKRKILYPISILPWRSALRDRLLAILQKVDACRDDFEALANGSDHKLVTLEVASGSSVHLGLPETFAGTRLLI